MYKYFLKKFRFIKMLDLFDRNAINMLPRIIQLIKKYLKEIWK